MMHHYDRTLYLSPITRNPILDLNKTEQEQIEALKQWWADNGKAVVTGIIIGLAVIFGWRSYQTYVLARAEAASDLYTNMVIEVRDNKNDKAREYADKLLTEYDGTAYATFAALMLARLDVADAKPDEAIKHLQLVLDHADEGSLKHLARLRMARILLDQNRPDEALSVLKVDDEGSYAASYSELKGDIYALQGKYDEARAAYQTTLGNAGGETNDTSFLQMKIDNLVPQKTQ